VGKTKQWVTNAFGPFEATVDPNLYNKNYRFEWETSGVYTCHSLHLFLKLEAVDSGGRRSNFMFSIVTIPYGEELGEDCVEGQVTPPPRLCPPREQAELGTITSIQLVDVAEGLVLRDSSQSTQFMIRLSETSGELNLIAETEGVIGSVVFEVDDGDFVKTADFSPFSLGGARPDRLLPSSLLVAGSRRVVRVTPYSGTNGGGRPGETVTVVLQIEDPLVVDDVVYVADIGSRSNVTTTLADGTTINLQQLSSKLVLEAQVSGDVGSVEFKVDGGAIRFVDSEAPYQVTAGEEPLFLPGHYILEVVPWTNSDATGSHGAPKTVEFDIVASQQT